MLSKPAITAPIIGASKMSHFDDGLAALNVELSADEIRQLEAPYSKSRIRFAGISVPHTLRVRIRPCEDAVPLTEVAFDQRLSDSHTPRLTEPHAEREEAPSEVAMLLSRFCVCAIAFLFAAADAQTRICEAMPPCAQKVDHLLS